MSDNDKIDAFFKPQGLVLDKSKFTVNEDDISTTADRNWRTGLCEFNSTASMAYITKLSTDINLLQRVLAHTNVKILKALPPQLLIYSKTLW